MKKDVRFLAADRDIRCSILRRWLWRCSAVLLFFILFVVLSRLCEVMALDLSLFISISPAISKSLQLTSFSFSGKLLIGALNIFSPFAASW